MGLIPHGTERAVLILVWRGIKVIAWDHWDSQNPCSGQSLARLDTTASSFKYSSSLSLSKLSSPPRGGHFRFRRLRPLKIPSHLRFIGWVGSKPCTERNRHIHVYRTCWRHEACSFDRCNLHFPHPFRSVK